MNCLPGTPTLMSMLRAIFVAALVFAISATAASAAKIDDQFRAWLASDLWPEAKANGVSKKTFDAAFDGVTPNLKLPDLVMPGAKAEDAEEAASRPSSDRPATILPKRPSAR